MFQVKGAIHVANDQAISQIIECQGLLKHLLERTKQAADTVGRGPGGREVSLTITSLQEAGHWLRDAKDILEQ